MKPLDPRLITHTESTKRYLLSTVAISVALTILIIVQSTTIARIITNVFQHNETLANCQDSVVLVIIVFIARAGLVWAQDVLANLASVRIKTQLRQKALKKIVELGPAWTTQRSSSVVTNTLTSNLDALDSYFSRYVPQLILSVFIPMTICVYFLTLDLLSTIIAVCTLPLIPFFMVLIGNFTQKKVDEQWRSLNHISETYSDLVHGLPTLKEFNKAKQQRKVVKEFGESYRIKTMAVLRISFLSAFTLELISTLSVALIAVSIGLRLIKGEIQLVQGLTILLLVPEVYAPLRLLGVHYHAAQEGLAAAEQIFEVLETQQTKHGNELLNRVETISLNNISFSYGEQKIFEDLNVRFYCGELVVICGASGSGKSTLVNLLLGYLQPDFGKVHVNDLDLVQISPDDWHKQIGYLPQNPWLAHSNVRNALQLAKPDATDDDMIKACADAGISAEGGRDLPFGLDTRINEKSGLSTGQRQRIALARSLLANSDVMILDEPTATLDQHAEQLIVETLQGLAHSGKLIIAVSHRPAMINAADKVVAIEAID